jgi:hypothetical protein
MLCEPAVVSTLKERIDLLRGKESLVAFAERVGIVRQTLYVAFDREKNEGEHRIDYSTAKLIADATGRTVSWVNGEEPDPLVAIQTAERDAMRAAGEDKSALAHASSNVMPALAHELDPTTQDAMRWRALAELQNDGADVAEAFQILGAVEFHREVRAVSWGDYYASAKRALKNAGRKAGDSELDPP